MLILKVNIDSHITYINLTKRNVKETMLSTLEENIFIKKYSSYKMT